MKLAIAGDHAGYALKQILADELKAGGWDVTDLGAHSTEPSDYPDFARAVGKAITTGMAERGILVCGSGAGASIAASKIRGIRAAVCHDTYTAHQAVEHDDMNVLCLGSRVIGTMLAREIVQAFLQARFSNEERHVRRVKKILEIEKAQA